MRNLARGSYSKNKFGSIEICTVYLQRNKKDEQQRKTYFYYNQQCNDVLYDVYVVYGEPL